MIMADFDFRWGGGEGEGVFVCVCGGRGVHFLAGRRGVCDNSKRL